MHALCKDELGKKYGPYTVMEYTSMRERSNGCVIWKVKCDCGHVRYINGNLLRFKHYGPCYRCGRRD